MADKKTTKPPTKKTAPPAPSPILETAQIEALKTEVAALKAASTAQKELNVLLLKEVEALTDAVQNLEKKTAITDPPEGLKFRAVRITKIGYLFSFPDTPDANKDGFASEAEAVAFAKSKGANGEGEKIGVLRVYEF